MDHPHQNIVVCYMAGPFFHLITSIMSITSRLHGRAYMHKSHLGDLLLTVRTDPEAGYVKAGIGLVGANGRHMLRYPAHCKGGGRG